MATTKKSKKTMRGMQTDAKMTPEMRFKREQYLNQLTKIVSKKIKEIQKKSTDTVDSILASSTQSQTIKNMDECNTKFLYYLQPSAEDWASLLKIKQEFESLK